MEIQKANGWAPFTHGQMHYSLLIRDIERDMVPAMERYGLSLTVWSPLVSGFLSGKYTRESLQEKDNRLSGFDRSVSEQHRRSSKPQQLDDNLAAAELHLAIDDLTALDVFTRPATVYPNWFTELVRDPAVEKALEGVV